MSAASSASEELRRGWPLVLAAAVGVGTGMSPLPLFSIGVFTKSIAAEFGWGRGDIQGMLAAFTFGALIGAPLTGYLIDRYGARPIVLFSTVTFGVGFAAVGLLTASLSTFYLIAFVTAVLGAGTLPVAWSRAIFEWFVIRRGLALGLALTGTGFAAFLLQPYATWLVMNVGWRMGYVGLGLLPIVLSLPLSVLFLRRPPDPVTPAETVIAKTGYRLGQAARGYRFYVIGASFFLASLGTGGIVTNLVPMLTDRGYSASDAAWVAAAQGLAVVFGRAITGYLLDRIWAPIIATVLLGLPVASCLFLASGGATVPLTFAAVVVVGLAGGAEFDLVAYLTARYFGMKHFGSVYGVLYATFVAAAGIAPGIFGHTFDVTGSYALILRICAGCFTGGALLVLTLGRYPESPVPPEKHASA